MQLGILCRRPFTADIAKEKVPEQLWGTAGFRKASYFLSWLWSALFLIMTISYVVSPCLLLLMAYKIPACKLQHLRASERGICVTLPCQVSG